MGGAIAENYWMDAHEVLASTARRGESLPANGIQSNVFEGEIRAFVSEMPSLSRGIPTRRTTRLNFQLKMQTKLQNKEKV